MAKETARERYATADWFSESWPEDISQPDDKTCAVWRYMDFPKFVWLISNKRLFMPSVRLLRRADPFECTVPPGLIAKIKKVLQDERENSGERSWAEALEVERLRQSFILDLAGVAYVSCWHCGDHFSDAMWKLYGTSHNSVAIKSHYHRLKLALPDHIRFGLVQYENFAVTGAYGHAAYSLFQKRADFKHENELRAVALPTSQLKQEMKLFGVNGGYAPEVDLQLLIAELHVNPLADPWFKDVVWWALKHAGFHKVYVRADKLIAIDDVTKLTLE